MDKSVKTPIHVLAERNKNGYICNPVKSDKTISKAFEHLVVYEIGFGGVVVEVTPTKVVTKTLVLADLDTTTFTGTIEDMELLVAFAIATIKLKANKGASALIEATALAGFEKLTSSVAGKPFFVTMLAPIFTGKQMVKFVLAAMLGVDIEQLGDTAKKMSLEDFCAAALLAIETEVTIQEVLDQVV